MRKRLAAALICTAASSASAAMVYDGFPYVVGNLGGNANTGAPYAAPSGTTWTRATAGTTDVAVVTGNLTFPNATTPSTGNMILLTHAGAVSDRLGLPASYG